MEQSIKWYQIQILQVFVEYFQIYHLMPTKENLKATFFKHLFEKRVSAFPFFLYSKKVFS